jgi:hypothetical protein
MSYRRFKVSEYVGTPAKDANLAKVRGADEPTSAILATLAGARPKP